MILQYKPAVLNRLDLVSYDRGIQLIVCKDAIIGFIIYNRYGIKVYDICALSLSSVFRIERIINKSTGLSDSSNLSPIYSIRG